jgi:hypothetical protein
MILTEYVKSTNFASKDALSTGNPLKIVKGTEIDTEFNNIATAVATKADLNSPTFIGTPAAPTASTGTNTTQLATTAFVQNTVDAHTVSTAQIEDSAVTADKIATGAVGNTELATDAVTQAKMASDSVGTAEIINANVTPAKLSQPLTLGTAVATTSGASIDFTSIPSWVKRITVMFNGVSLSGTSNYLIQLGDSGGLETTGYNSTSAMAWGGSTTIGGSFTTGFGVVSQAAANSISGSVTLLSISGNTWISNHSVGYNQASSSAGASGGGSKTLSDTLTQIRITTVNGTDTFDAGSVNILYE